jgi:hypothetical protein
VIFRIGNERRSMDAEKIKRELAVFSCFLEAHPSFAAEVELYSPAAKEPADIAVKLKNGGSIGFQLGQWVHERQMREAKRKEELRAKLHDVLRPCLEHRPRNFARVGIFVRDAHFDQRDTDAFRAEFIRIVSDADHTWHKDPRRRPGGYTLTSGGCPAIDKYSERILFLPRDSHMETVISNALDRGLNDPEISHLLEQWAQEVRVWREARGLYPVGSEQADPWIVFPLEGGAYSSQPALQALNEILAKKTAKYARLQAGDLRLIIHYNDAVLYNTPYEDQEHETFATMACEAAGLLAGKNVAPFNEVYLLRALWPNPEAFRVWPTVSKCT